ncbi:MAG TPA: ribose-phosphate diphosphokinase [Steroidobacter sp.]|nr:ribose-phosphate diphosphokinase [Steroidobacter sp.]
MGKRETLLFAPAHTAVLAERTARALGLALAPSEEREFDGGEHKIRPLREVRGCDVFVMQSLAGDEHASANDKLCRLLFFIGALKDAGAARVTACTPYLCYARKDRRTQARDPVTTRYVAAMFEAVGVDRVLVLEVHNEAAFDNAFRCEAIRLSSGSVFSEHLARLGASSNLTVASPDVGGIKRAQVLRETLASKFNDQFGFAFMEKRRAAGVVSGDKLIGDVAGRDVLIFDDLIASGGTIARAARAARAAGARRVYAAASHAVFTPAAVQLFDPDGPDAVLVSDSVALPAAFERFTQGSLQICSVAPLFAAAITELVRSD